MEPRLRTGRNPLRLTDQLQDAAVEDYGRPNDYVYVSDCHLALLDSWRRRLRAAAIEARAAPKMPLPRTCTYGLDPAYALGWPLDKANIHGNR